MPKTLNLDNLTQLPETEGNPWSTLLWGNGDFTLGAYTAHDAIISLSRSWAEDKGENRRFMLTSLEETIKALEQVWDSRVPEICVHRSFEYFLKNRLSAIAPSEASLRIVAHPNGKELNLEQHHSSNTAAVVAIGPERGWSSREIELLEAQGFRLTGLGERVLRVEVALTFLLGQLELLLPTA